MINPIKQQPIWYQILFLLYLLVGYSTVSMAQEAPNNPRGIETAQGEVKWVWDAIGDTRYYEVTVDGQFADFTRDPQFFSRNLWAGEHSMTVIAVLNDGRRSSQSVTAKITVSANFNSPAGSTPQQNEPQSTPQNDQAVAASSGSVQAPNNPRGVEVGQGTVQWEWDWVAGAANYEVTVDGAVVATTSNTNLFSENLWAGDHSLRVRAVSGGGQYSGPSATAKIVVSGNYNSSNPAQSFAVGGSSGSASASTNSESNSQPPPPEENPQPQNPVNDNGTVDVVSWSIPEAHSKPGYELVFSTNSIVHRSTPFAGIHSYAGMVSLMASAMNIVLSITKTSSTLIL